MARRLDRYADEPRFPSDLTINVRALQEGEHAGNIITRYCHMESQPLVVVGQRVTAGQPIGRVRRTIQHRHPFRKRSVDLSHPAPYCPE